MSEVSVSREIAADLFDFQVDTLIIGAGACGMVAALAAHEAGREVLILDRDPLPSGSTRALRRPDPRRRHAFPACGGRR